MARPDPTTLSLRDARAYVIRVLLSGQPRTISGVDGMRDGVFALPRNPISVQYQAQARTFVYAAGTQERRADPQGVDPPTITVGIDFGERGAYDPASKQGLDGRRAMRALEHLVRGYLKTVAEQGRARRPLHVMEWHDVYRGESWVVMPAAVPYGMEEAGRPYSEGASLRFDALQRADTAVKPVRTLNARLTEHASACPLNPACRYGGTFTAGCPYRRAP